MESQWSVRRIPTHSRSSSDIDNLGGSITAMPNVKFCRLGAEQPDSTISCKRRHFKLNCRLDPELNPEMTTDRWNGLRGPS